jgi:hypothetical protein
MGPSDRANTADRAPRGPAGGRGRSSTHQNSIGLTWIGARLERTASPASVAAAVGDLGAQQGKPLL